MQTQVQVMQAQGQALQARTTQEEYDGLLDAFISQYSAKESSRRTYRRSLRQYFTWLQTTGRDLKTLTKADILAYASYLLPEDEDAQDKSSHGAVTVAHSNAISGISQRKGACMRHRHGLWGLGADHQGRVTIDNPCLVGTNGLLLRSAVVVEDTHQTVDGDTTESAAGVTLFRQNVDAIILTPHGRNPRLANVRHQGTDGTGRLAGAAVGSIHPSLSETVATMVVFTH